MTPNPRHDKGRPNVNVLHFFYFQELAGATMAHMVSTLDTVTKLLI